MIFRLDERIIFPKPDLAEPDGLLAVGGDLSAERLLLAYQNGIFPWYSDDTPILWYSPHTRCVIFPEEIKISKSMRQVLRSDQFEVTADRNFNAVIEACASVVRKDQHGTWITEAMKKAYIDLRKRGYAHSWEVWNSGQLVGGLYGVEIGRVFCGESMFSQVSNASKIALIHLCQTGKYDLIDCQMPTDHLKSMGARMIGRTAYNDYLYRYSM